MKSVVAKTIIYSLFFLITMIATLASVEALLRLNRSYVHLDVNDWTHLAFHRYPKLGPSPQVSIDPSELAAIGDSFAALRQKHLKLSHSALYQTFENHEDGNYRVREFTRFNDLVYDVNYQFRNDRRVSVPPPPSNPLFSLLLLGGSVTLGEGLPNNQMLASYLQKRVENGVVSTVGSHGWGATDLLLRLMNPAGASPPSRPFDNLPPAKKAVAVYVFISDHMRRMVCPLSCYSEENEWLRDRPDFSVTKEGALHFDGSFRETRHFSPYARWIADSAIVKELGIEWPSPYSAQEQLKMAKVVLAIRDKLNEKYPLDGFYLMIHPSSVHVQLDTLEQALESKGVRILETRTLNLKSLTGGKEKIPIDGHPTAQMNYILASYLAPHLQNDYPDLKLKTSGH